MDEPSPSPLSLPLLAVFYGGMVGVALLLVGLFDLPSPWRRPDAVLPGWAGLALGLGLGVLAHALGMLARRRWGWARGFYDQLARAIGSASTPRVTAAALASGFAEELLFRGALLPLLGLLPQAVLFGVLHIGPGRAFWIWPLYATVMGLLFGVLYQASGSLLPPVLAHFTVNFFGLARLARSAPGGSR